MRGTRKEKDQQEIATNKNGVIHLAPSEGCQRENYYPFTRRGKKKVRHSDKFSRHHPSQSYTEELDAYSVGVRGGRRPSLFPD